MERAEAWKQREMSWAIDGPSSGGQYTILVSRGRVFHQYDGDACPPGDAGFVEESPEDFARRGRYPFVIEWLRAHGYLKAEG